MADYEVNKVLDLKGLPCPMPVVRMSQEIGSVDVGQVIEVHTTDPGSLADFPDGPRAGMLLGGRHLYRRGPFAHVACEVRIAGAR